MILYQLTRCFAFRRIQHPHLPWITKYLPLLVTAVAALVFLFLPITPRLFGDGSITRNMISLLSILPGFFIAALAAVATFTRESLDQVMPDPPPKLALRSGDAFETVDLTMRMFLCHMFAYLTAVSFAAALFCIVGEVVAPSVSYIIELCALGRSKPIATGAVKTIYVCALAWMTANIAFTTLFGMYFLAERMHRPRA